MTQRIHLIGPYGQSNSFMKAWPKRSIPGCCNYGCSYSYDILLSNPQVTLEGLVHLISSTTVILKSDMRKQTQKDEGTSPRSHCQDSVKSRFPAERLTPHQGLLVLTADHHFILWEGPRVMIEICVFDSWGSQTPCCRWIRYTFMPLFSK